MKKKVLVIINAVTLLLMLLANYGSFTFIFSNETVASVSFKYNTLFAPAGYAFAIWSLIFFLCIGFVVYQINLLFKKTNDKLIEKCGYWFALGNMFNAFWVYVWTNEWLGISVLLIVGLLITLIQLMLVIRSGSEKNSNKLWVYLPISIYLGWIIVATVACIAAWLVYMGWNGWGLGPLYWTIILILIASLIYLALLVKYSLVSTAFVGIWAFTAIVVKHWNKEPRIVVAGVSAVLILIVFAVKNFLEKKKLSTN